MKDGHPRTPDGRYFVVNQRLWRLSNPELDDDVRSELVSQLMTARAALKDAQGNTRKRLRGRIDRLKIRLGERGPVWWADGAPDFNRYLIKNTPYRTWWEAHQTQR